MEVTREQMLEYGRKVKAAHPGITGEQMRTLLEGKFLCGIDAISAPVLVSGAVANPVDWIMGVIRLVEGLLKLITTETKKGKIDGIRKMIEGVIIILY